MGYESLPRVPLATLPTPLEEMKRVRETIGGPRLFLKRDDLTGLGLGGNKLRKLEFLMGDALAKGADTIVTSGVMQTNHGRLTAAACAKLGLRCILVMTEPECGYFEGNRILQELFGAEQVFADIDYTVPPEKLAKEKLRAGDVKIAEVMENLQREGRKPYLIPRAGRSLQGTASYCQAMAELHAQLTDRGIHADHIIAPIASGSTFGGIMLGARICGMDAKVHGMAMSRSAEEGREMVEEEFNHDAETMGYPFRITQSDLAIYGEYMGDAYGVMTEGCQNAIRLFASAEGILLDPVYTGKTMAGYLDLLAKGAFRDDETVIFFHTGGIPLLFLRDVSDWLADARLQKG
jgi:1-aminocyclopropane-1-carboxylate deaminase